MGVSIPEPVQDYSELPLFEPVAAQGVEIAKIRTYFENHDFPPFCKQLQLINCTYVNQPKKHQYTKTVAITHKINAIAIFIQSTRTSPGFWGQNRYELLVEVYRQLILP